MSTGETRVLLILLGVEAVPYETISNSDNKAYKLACPNNKQDSSHDNGDNNGVY